MSTGAPLNLPKPKATTNTGQDLIEIGNSLQKINDAIKGIQDDSGRVDIWPELEMLYTGTGSWVSRFALLDRSTKMLHLHFQISGISPTIQPGGTLDVLRIPRGIYGDIAHYAPLVGTSTGQFVLIGSTRTLTLHMHANTNATSLIRCNMTIALA